MILPSKGEGNQNAGLRKRGKGHGEEVGKRNGGWIRSEEIVIRSTNVVRVLVQRSWTLEGGTILIVGPYPVTLVSWHYVTQYNKNPKNTSITE